MIDAGLLPQAKFTPFVTSSYRVYYYLLHLLPMIIFTQMMSRVPNGITYILVKKAAYSNLIDNLDTYSRY